MKAKGHARYTPLPWKHRETVFHPRGGVFPPTPPLPDEGDNFDTLPDEGDNFENSETLPDEGDNFENLDGELPPLVPMEESDLPQGHMENQVDPLSEALSQEEDRRSRPVRQLRNRSVARSVVKDRRVQFREVVDCVEQGHQYKEQILFEKEGTLLPPLEHQGDVDYLSSERWELLYDPTPSRALKRTRQQASVVAQQVLAKPSVSVVSLMDQREEATGYTVLSDAVPKKMDRDERKYQKAMMICVQGIGASLKRSADALDVVDGLGQSHHDSLRSAKWEIRNRTPFTDSVPSIQPWASVIQQTFSHQDVPEYFQKDDTMKHSIEILEEEVLQTTTCTPKDIYMDIQGWTTAFEVELFLFSRWMSRLMYMKTLFI